jgi:hypothetical protein
MQPSKPLETLKPRNYLPEHTAYTTTTRSIQNEFTTQPLHHRPGQLIMQRPKRSSITNKPKTTLSFLNHQELNRPYHTHVAYSSQALVPCRRLPCLPAQASQLAASTYIHLHRQKQTTVSKPMGTGVSEDLVLLLLYELKSLVQVSWFTRHDSNTGIYAAHSNTSLYVSFCCK